MLRPVGDTRGADRADRHKKTRLRGHFYLAEWTGLAYILQAAAALASATLLAPRRSRAGGFLHSVIGRPLRGRVTLPNKKTRLRGHFYLAEWTGLEPATPGVTGRYSNQLNYHSGSALFGNAQRSSVVGAEGFEPPTYAL